MDPKSAIHLLPLLALSVGTAALLSPPSAPVRNPAQAITPESQILEAARAAEPYAEEAFRAACSAPSLAESILLLRGIAQRYAELLAQAPRILRETPSAELVAAIARLQMAQSQVLLLVSAQLACSTSQPCTGLATSLRSACADLPAFQRLLKTLK